MIVSHRHKLIHLKAIKVGGSSFEAAFSAHCGPDDIVTRIHPEPPPRADGTRHREQNARGIRGHAPWREVRELVGDDLWRRYLKVTIVRNPWDMAVSRMFQRNPGVADVAEARRRLAAMLDADAEGRPRGALGPGEHIFLRPDGTPVADRVLRHESMQSGSDALFRTLGLPEGQLPRLKSSTRSIPGGSDQFHSASTIELTGTLWRATVRTFGYEPPTR